MPIYTKENREQNAKSRYGGKALITVLDLQLGRVTSFLYY